jgi:hypothetical protein
MFKSTKIKFDEKDGKKIVELSASKFLYIVMILTFLMIVPFFLLLLLGSFILNGINFLALLSGLAPLMIPFIVFVTLIIFSLGRVVISKNVDNTISVQKRFMGFYQTSVFQNAPKIHLINSFVPINRFFFSLENQDIKLLIVPARFQIFSNFSPGGITKEQVSLIQNYLQLSVEQTNQKWSSVFNYL